MHARFYSVDLVDFLFLYQVQIPFLTFILFLNGVINKKWSRSGIYCPMVDA